VMTVDAVRQSAASPASVDIAAATQPGAVPPVTVADASQAH